jgi:excinuclease UvrABC nuclease subunit
VPSLSLSAGERAVRELATLDAAAYEGSKAKLIKAKRKEMHEAADNLDFETAALLRDEIAALEQADVKKKK